MVDSVIGTRISEMRRRMGVTQAEMARRIGISPSYLNLIERNKRRIAGTLLRRTAEELDVRVDDLDGAPERRLAEALTEIAHLPTLDGLGARAETVPELIARFPGWARATATLARSQQSAQETARALSDRLTHDPFLGETVHRMLTHVAAIRSAGEILTEFSDLEASQRAEFHRIVRDGSERLTETGEALAAYFDRTDETEARLTPLDEIEALYEAQGNHFAALEAAEDVDSAINGILAAAPEIETDAARHRAADRLRDYAKNARAMPADRFAADAARLRCDIDLLAEEYRTGVDAVCRRLATLPGASGLPRCGYFQANASGTIIEMLGVEGLSLPRYAATCPLWVLFRAQQMPGQTMCQPVEMPTGAGFVFVARARLVGPPGFGQARHYVTDMLAMPAADAGATVYASRQTPEPVGPACRICPRTECLHRVADPLAG